MTRRPLGPAALDLLAGATGFVAAIVGLISSALPAAAQRAPVLQQIKVRHPYYYREMFVPQVTSGPSAAAWSPDGTDLVYSMQGSLWRQRVGSNEARQLTDGPGYDYQPDWSPDGRRIVYASYRNDAIELRLLDLATGESAQLLAGGAVHLEPRWSPDGTRLAFTSTLYEGRWHVFTADVTPDGRTTSPIYVTVGDRPVRSADDAAYFVAWIDPLATAARANADWNTVAERDHALELIGQAREEFERRR